MRKKRKTTFQKTLDTLWLGTIGIVVLSFGYFFYKEVYPDVEGNVAVSQDCLTSLQEAHVSWEYTPQGDDAVLMIRMNPNGARAVKKNCKPYAFDPRFLKAQMYKYGYQHLKEKLGITQ